MNNNIYMFWYCLQHDDGFLIKHNIKEVPLWCKMCNSKCDEGEWTIMGIIDYDGTRVIEISEINMDYDKYCGGYEFEYYSNEYIDEEGKHMIPKDSVLGIWFNAIINNIM
jgi:hypothetical protein